MPMAAFGSSQPAVRLQEGHGLLQHLFRGNCRVDVGEEVWPIRWLRGRGCGHLTCVRHDYCETGKGSWSASWVSDEPKEDTDGERVVGVRLGHGHQSGAGASGCGGIGKAARSGSGAKGGSHSGAVTSRHPPRVLNTSTASSTACSKVHHASLTLTRSAHSLHKVVNEFPQCPMTHQ